MGSLSNGVSMDFHDYSAETRRSPRSTMHFWSPGPSSTKSSVGFESVVRSTGRIQECNRSGEINTQYGGRGVYFSDPDGQLLEIITRPYGSAPR
jgi:hypothetical protein